jgi:hypothetical protein
MLIKQSDYHRIYSIINSLVVSEKGNPAVACMFFSVFGSFILKQHFNINAAPKGGLAAYRLDNNFMLFGDMKDDGYVSGDGENFHCWVEADGWALDFMAPAFAGLEHGKDVPSKMFQKPMSEMAKSVNDVERSGDFYYGSTPQATAQRFAHWKNNPMIGDLADLAVLWFRKSPKKMMGAMTVADQNGKPTEVRLSGRPLVGTW